VFSDLPSLRLSGWLSAFSMVAALIADLFILRPTSMFLINMRDKIRWPAGQPKAAESRNRFPRSGNYSLSRAILRRSCRKR
jgi:hypothetical protein